MTTKLSSFKNRWESDEKDKLEFEWQKWSSAIGKLLDSERSKMSKATVFNFSRDKAGKDYINLENIGKYI